MQHATAHCPAHWGTWGLLLVPFVCGPMSSSSALPPADARPHSTLCSTQHRAALPPKGLEDAAHNSALPCPGAAGVIATDLHHGIPLLLHNARRNLDEAAAAAAVRAKPATPSGCLLLRRTRGRAGGAEQSSRRRRREEGGGDRLSRLEDKKEILCKSVLLLADRDRFWPQGGADDKGGGGRVCCPVGHDLVERQAECEDYICNVCDEDVDDGGESWLTAAIRMDNPCCSCKPPPRHMDGPPTRRP